MYKTLWDGPDEEEVLGDHVDSVFGSQLAKIAKEQQPINCNAR